MFPAEGDNLKRTAPSLYVNMNLKGAVHYLPTEVFSALHEAGRSRRKFSQRNQRADK